MTTLTHNYSSQASSTGLSALASSLVGWAKRGRLQLRLEQLDPRMLEDIGISYAEIPSFVKQVYPTVNWLKGLKAVVKPIVDWHQRVRLMAELSSMSDAMLKDIGITRTDIRQVVYHGMQRPVSKPVPENVHFFNANRSQNAVNTQTAPQKVKRHAA